MTGQLMTDLALFGGIEGGGTKFVCAVAHSPDRIIESVTVPTTTARETLDQCVRFFVSVQDRHGPIATFGFCTFGPIELDADSADFGRMMPTPKPGWSGVDVLQPLRAAFTAPIALDTDVGAAALAEWRFGAGRGVGSLAYVTVGTGIGGAIAPHDAHVGRLMHAEMGHIPVRRDVRDKGFSGVCPFHGDCLEGVASGTAISARWGCKLEALPPDHVGWSIIGGYLGQLAVSIALLHSVERIVFGGGVISNGALLSHIHSAAFKYLNNYLLPLTDPERAANYICVPALGSRAGITGSLLLAQGAAAAT